MITVFLTTILHFSQIGEQIWQNECKGDVEKLVFWNPREAFPSLGIGHFIWLPKDATVPFEESFPKLVQFLKDQKVAVPIWMEGSCPWKTREEFIAAQSGDQVRQLRALVEQTIPLQVRFLHTRLEAVEKSLEPHRAKIERLKASNQGLYALIDYLNFKGSGLAEKERYQGNGWGLLQVLEEMPEKGSVEEAPKQFAEGAKTVLKRRVTNAPSEIEGRWLNGWLSRVESYCGASCK